MLLHLLVRGVRKRCECYGREEVNECISNFDLRDLAMAKSDVNERVSIVTVEDIVWGMAYQL